MDIDIGAILLGLVGIGSFLWTFFRQKDKNLDAIVAAVRSAVEATEQVFSNYTYGYTNQQKKEYALNAAKSLLKLIGVTLDDKILSNLIEAEVLKLPAKIDVQLAPIDYNLPIQIKPLPITANDSDRAKETVDRLIDETMKQVSLSNDKIVM